MDIALIVLAAGLSTRFGGEKTLAPVGPSGEVLLDYAVFDAIRARVAHVVVVVRREHESKIQDHLAKMVGGATPIDYVRQDTTNFPLSRHKPWGTGHAVLSAAAHVNDGCVVLNADDLYGLHALSLAAEHLRSTSGTTPAEHALVAYQLGNTPMSTTGGVSRAVVDMGDDGYLRSIEEVREIRPAAGAFVGRAPDGASVTLHAATLVSMNLWAFHRSIFDTLGQSFDAFRAHSKDDPTAEFLIGSAVNEAIQAGRGRVRVLETHERGIGLTWSADAASASLALRDLMEHGHYPARLAEGFATMAEQARECS